VPLCPTRQYDGLDVAPVPARKAPQYKEHPMRTARGTPLPKATVAETHVRRVLDGSPEPFATATDLKRAALAHFQPEGALVSHGPERTARRRFNERVLESDNPMHRLAERFVGVAVEETGELLADVRRNGGTLEWEPYAESWFRIVRRVVFGDGARDDRQLRRLVNDLRSDANRAFLKPKRRHRRDEFFDRLNGHLARAEPGSLAAVMATTPRSRKTAPDQQVPQWLFAFDPAGMTTFRALALLAIQDDQAVPPASWPLIPFSGGPAICPGRNLVLLIASHVLGTLNAAGPPRLESADKLPPDALPGSLNNYGLRFRYPA
jgi:cytochrome P450